MHKLSFNHYVLSLVSGIHDEILIFALCQIGIIPFEFTKLILSIAKNIVPRLRYKRHNHRTFHSIIERLKEREMDRIFLSKWPAEHEDNPNLRVLRGILLWEIYADSTTATKNALKMRLSRAK